MIRVAIAAEAIEAIRRRSLLGSVGYETSRCARELPRAAQRVVGRHADERLNSGCHLAKTQEASAWPFALVGIFVRR
jgi:hypothetical protein